MLDRYAVEISEYENGVIDTGTGELVPVCDAPLPIVYERATKALAECARIDECQDWANKAKALASYARQSKDDTLRKMADRIQARAIRRCGELLKQVEAGQGARDGKRHDATDMPLNRTAAATQAGLSERQKVTALRVASIPQPEFEMEVESDQPPTITKLAEQGKQEKLKPLHDLEGIDPYLYARATELQGAIKRLAAYCQKHDPKAIAGAFKHHEKDQIRSSISHVEAWIDQFIVNL
ncbi:MAG: hypothetical protein VW778_08275 [Betaproteobacteria bacterium]